VSEGELHANHTVAALNICAEDARSLASEYGGTDDRLPTVRTFPRKGGTPFDPHNFLRSSERLSKVRRVDDRRWGFEDAEDWEYERPGGQPASAGGSEETLVGQDADQVVEVVVSPTAEVIAVRLSPRWRGSVDPRVLDASVLSAANAATMRALAHSVEHTDLSAPAPAPPHIGGDESPLTNQDVQRLLDSVSAELDQFTTRLSAVVDQPVQVRSSGGHVQGSAQRGQVITLDVDSTWAGQARHSEIETEFVEVLRGLHDMSIPRELAAGPGGGAVSELMALAADPRCLMRRLGMPVGGTETAGES
jgi:hypothetical protein